MFAAERRGRLGEAAGEVDGHVADRVECAGGVAGAGAADVVAETDVQHMEAAVLDVPAATQLIQQASRVGSGSRQAGDGVGRALANGAVGQLRVPIQAEQLLSSGPVEIALVDGRRRRGDGPRLEAAAILLDRRRGLLLSECLLNLIGGKSLRG